MILTFKILAGDREFAIYSWISSEYLITSIFSVLNSLITVITRAPFGPIALPIGSISGSFLSNAIFVLSPGSRAVPLISICPEAISGTSNSKSFSINFGLALERKIK